VAANALLRTLLSQQPDGEFLLDDAHQPEVEIAAVVAVLYRLSVDQHERKILEHAISASLQNTDGDIARFAPRETINMFLVAPGL